MRHTFSKQDMEFASSFKAGTIQPGEFGHKEHLRLAFIYLCEGDAKTATDGMRTSLRQFLKANSISDQKYHETLTRAWVLAVRHFMRSTKGASSFEGFLSKNERLLRPDLLLSHYSTTTLFSEKARGHFVIPDLQPF